MSTAATKQQREKNPYPGRRESLRKLLAAEEHEYFFVSGLANIRYLTGFHASNGIVLMAPDGPVLYTDGRYAIQARQQAGEVDVRVFSEGFLSGVINDLKDRKIRRLGFERNRLSFAEYQYLKENLRGCRLSPLTQLVEAQRAVKSPDEVERIRRSTVLNSKAFDNVCRRAQPDWTESRMAAEIEYEMCSLGATGKAFDTIVASGARSALPHATPGKHLLRRNAPIVVDQGAILDGYTSDMTRMVCFGKPGPRLRELHRAVREAQAAATDAVRAGVKARTVDREARRVLRKFKLEKAFPHSTGHGLGLEIHEPPQVGPAEETRLVTGMVITIEPGAYLEDVGGVRIEDVVVVTPTGCRVLTRTSRQLRVL